MKKYLLKRLVLCLIVIFGVILITFTISRVVPSDAAAKWAGARATPEQVEAAREELGLNDPYPVQFFNYIKDLLHGDLGYSLRTRNPVMSDLKAYIPATLELVILSTILAIIIGLPLGLYSAKHKNKLLDHVARFVSIGGVSIGFQKTGLVNGFGRGEHPGFHGLSGRSRAQRLKTAVFDLRSRRLDVVKRDPDLIQIFHSLRPGILPLEFQFQDPVGFRHDRKLELLVGLAEIPIGGHRERTGILAHPERIAALGGECNFNGNGGSSVDLEVSRGAFHSKESGRGEQEQVKFLHDSVLSEWFVVNEFYNGLH